MANIGRLTKEFLVCGITGFTGSSYEGAPVFDPALSPANQVIADLIYAAHVEDDETFLRLDQRTDPDCIEVYNAVSPEQWDAYRSVQRDYVKYEHRKKIREACCLEKDTPNDLMIKWLKTGEPADKQAWLTAMQTIKNGLPYPSGQSD